MAVRWSTIVNRSRRFPRHYRRHRPTNSWSDLLPLGRRLDPRHHISDKAERASQHEIVPSRWRKVRKSEADCNGDAAPVQCETPRRCPLALSSLSCPKPSTLRNLPMCVGWVDLGNRSVGCRVPMVDAHHANGPLTPSVKRPRTLLRLCRPQNCLASLRERQRFSFRFANLLQRRLEILLKFIDGRGCVCCERRSLRR
jgi:hypothetical protein